jgi:hypothetical protein
MFSDRCLGIWFTPRFVRPNTAPNNAHKVAILPWLVGVADEPKTPPAVNARRHAAVCDSHRQVVIPATAQEVEIPAGSRLCGCSKDFRLIMEMLGETQKWKTANTHPPEIALEFLTRFNVCGHPCRIQNTQAP